jgi:hypothetical protein
MLGEIVKRAVQEYAEILGLKDWTYGGSLLFSILVSKRIRWEENICG